MSDAAIERTPGQTALLPAATSFGQLVITSGLVSPRALGGEQLTIEHEIAEALAELIRVLEHAGSRADRVLKLDAFLASADDFDEWNRQYQAHWPDERPARTTLVSGFTTPLIRFEVQATAARI